MEFTPHLVPVLSECVMVLKSILIDSEILIAVTEVLSRIFLQGRDALLKFCDLFLDWNLHSASFSIRREKCSISDKNVS